MKNIFSFSGCIKNNYIAKLNLKIFILWGKQIFIYTAWQTAAEIESRICEK